MSAAWKDSAIRVDILVIGGGTAGAVAAIKAKEALPEGEVLLLKTANVKRSSDAPNDAGASVAGVE